MKEKSVKINFIMNMVLTCSTYVYQLLVFPYTARVLGAVGNGKVSFAISFVNYFATFAALGIPMYGIRACSIVRDDREKLSRTCCELFCLNTITTLISYTLLIFIALMSESLDTYRSVIVISATLLPLQLLATEWLFKAMEEYSYITIRSLIFKLISMILMFCLVRNGEHYAVYAWINVFASGGSAIVNIRRVKRYVSPVSLKTCDILQHVKPILSFFLLAASWTLFSNLGVVMLGFLRTEYEVGLYSIPTRISTILVTAVTALGPVLLPRLSNYYNKSAQKAMYFHWVKVNLRFTLIVGLAATVFCWAAANDVILILGGSDYLPSVNSLRILLISMFLIGISEIMGTGMLVPMGKEHVTVVGTVLGIIVAVCTGLLLIPKWGIVGAALSITVGEAVISGVQLIYLRKTIGQIVSMDTIWKPIVSVTVALCVMVVVSQWLLCTNVIVRIVVEFVAFCGTYLSVLVLIKESLVYSIFSSFLSKMGNGKYPHDK